MAPNGDGFSAAVAGAVRAELSRRQRTVSEAAAAIGVSRGHLSNLLNGGKALDTDQIAAIASFLEIPVERIFDSAALTYEAAS